MAEHKFTLTIGNIFSIHFLDGRNNLFIDQSPYIVYKIFHLNRHDTSTKRFSRIANEHTRTHR